MFPVAVQAPADYQNANRNEDLELVVELIELAVEYVQKAVALFAGRN
ncbi:MAG: hypothetical protein U0105_22410 [Candidatus Obscuribacterales bacterium]